MKRTLGPIPHHVFLICAAVAIVTNALCQTPAPGWMTVLSVVVSVYATLLVLGEEK